MKYIEKLKTSTEEYIKNIDANNIINMKVIIPKFNGSFTIFTNHQLLVLQESKTTELCIFFSFNTRSNKDKKLLKKIADTNCLSDFIVFNLKDEVTYIKRTNNKILEIINTVDRIIQKLFSDINQNKINIELGRISEWHTLNESNTENKK